MFGDWEVVVCTLIACSIIWGGGLWYCAREDKRNAARIDAEVRAYRKAGLL